MKKKRKLGRKLLSFLLTLAMLVGLVPGMSLTAYAAGVQYKKADGTTGNCTEYTEVTSSGSVTWKPGWYVVNSNVTITGNITTSATTGDINLILCDGCELSLPNGYIGTGSSSSTSGHNLNIYGQTNGTGKLTVTNSSSQNNVSGRKYVAAIWSYGDLTINGGIVNVAASDTDYSRTYEGIWVQGNLTIKNANVTATAVHDCISSSALLTITNATVTATSGNTGIYGSNISISGNKTNITASGKNYGIQTPAFNKISIESGCKVEAQGASQAAIYHYLTNADPAIGWTNFDGTQGVAVIKSGTDQQLNYAGSSYYKKVVLPGVLVESVTLDQTSAEVTVGSDTNTVQLTATAAPDNAIDKSIIWSSSNTGVATVDQNGLVTAVGTGTATITATAAVGTSTAKATCSVTVNKQAGSISYGTTTVDKTFGDEAFTNPLTKTGDGEVTYASSQEGVAVVDENGLVSIKNVGSTTISATVADSSTYTYATKTVSYTLNVAKADMTVNAQGWSGKYDGQQHGITVDVTKPASGATIKYRSTNSGEYNLTQSPVITDVSESPLTVYYQITAGNNYNEVTGSETVTIEKADAAELTSTDAAAQITVNYPDETATYSDGYEISTDGTNAATTSPVSLTAVLNGTGTPTIHVRIAETENTAAGSWVAVTLASRPAAPENLGSTNATCGSSADGMITGVDSAMEYSADGTNWIDVTDTTITGLNPGTYQVRVKATGSAPHGAATEVTVGNNYVALDNTTKPVIEKGGDPIGETVPVAGDELTATTTASDVVYQWYRGEDAISGATGDTYTLTADDVGKTITVKVTQTKKEDGTDYDTDGRPTQTSDLTEAVEKKDGPAAPASAQTAGFDPDYEAETFTVGNDYEVSTSQNDSGVITNGSLVDALNGTGKVYIRAKETDDTKAGAWLEVTLPDRPNAPTGLTTENATNATTADGKIKDTTTAMEYSADDGETWTTASDTETAVKPGTYLVRIKATTTAPAGKTTEVTVDDNLEEAKTAAKADLDTLLAGKAEADYDAEDWTTLTTAITDGKTAIDNATTIDGVTTEKNTAIEAVNAIKTKAEKLADAKTAAKADLDTLLGEKTEADYDAEDWTTLTTAIADGKDAIDNATTIDGVTTEKNAAIEAVNAVKTKAEKVEDTINALPDFSDVTTANKDAIEAARAAYNALTDAQKAQVSANTLKKLTDAEDKLGIVQVMSEVSAKTGDGMTYTGNPIQLINTPTTALPAGYTMKYAVTTENVKPTDEKMYTTDIPTETEAGTYYVWYKVVGDENHNDVEPECVKVTIAEEKKQDEPVKPETPAKTVDMYRLYNPNSGEHFYTASVGERDMLTELGWRYEGIGWKAPEKSNTPVYRLYNPNAGDHHYTVNVNERDWLVSLGWRYEGIGWYSDDNKSVPLYRQYNPNAKAGNHNYTASKSENDWLVGLGWRYEGVGWYGVK